MGRISATLADEQHEWIREQAEERDRSQADIVRMCIEAVQSESLQLEPEQRDAMQSDALSDLRARVRRLERELKLDGERERIRGAGGESEEIEPGETPSPGSNPHTQTVETAVEYAREHQPVTRAEIIEVVGDEVDIRGDSLWKRHIRDALKEAGFTYDRSGGVATWTQPDG